MRRHRRKKVFVSVVKIETGVWVRLGAGGGGSAGKDFSS